MSLATRVIIGLIVAVVLLLALGIVSIAFDLLGHMAGGVIGLGSHVTKHHSAAEDQRITSKLGAMPSRLMGVGSGEDEIALDHLFTSYRRFLVSQHRPKERVLPLPEPTGHAAPVIAEVLQRVVSFTSGGLNVDWDELAETANGTRMHGADVGLDPKTRELLWKPTPFDFSKETEAMKRVAHTKSCFNKRRSDSIPLHRDIPDVRPQVCQNNWYYHKKHLPGLQKPSSLWASIFGEPKKEPKSKVSEDAVQTDELVLPDTSVVFVMYNEPLSPLLRSVYSVLDRTPPQLLREVIIVDDGSDAEAPWLAVGGEFETHLSYLPKVKLCRLKGRNGLMRARNVGISLAVGDTVTILDSHIEVNEGWLEPLMGRIAEGREAGIHRVVVPSIDSIEADDFVYKAGGIDILGHSWTLGQVGVYRASAVVSVEPMPSPIMAGGLLAFERSWFNDLGFYDPMMRLWGGEESEISFRIWQCGGTLECVPCSRVGHIFRSNKHWQGQVYKVPGYEVTRNKLRAASVWMDEYADLVWLASMPLPKDVELGSLEYMKNIRTRLQCKPYRWYIENIFPEIMPSAERLMGHLGSGTLKANGYIRSPGLSACVDTLMRKHPGEALSAYPCHYQHGTQSYVAAADGTIVVAELTFSTCLTREADFTQRNDSSVLNGKCDDNNALQKWVFMGKDNEPSWIYEKEAEGGTDNPKGCLTVVQKSESDGKSPLTLRVRPCVVGDTNQLWQWERIGSVGSPSSYTGPALADA